MLPEFVNPPPLVQPDQRLPASNIVRSSWSGPYAWVLGSDSKISLIRGPALGVWVFSLDEEDVGI